MTIEKEKIAKNPEDESSHQPSHHKFWDESFYFNFIDFKSHLGGVIRLGFTPNYQQFEAGLGLSYPLGLIGINSTRDLQKRSKHPISIGSYQLDCLEPFKKWRVSYQGEVYCFHSIKDAIEAEKVSSLNQGIKKQVNLELEFISIHEPILNYFHLEPDRLPLEGLKDFFRQPRQALASWLQLKTTLNALKEMKGAQRYDIACLVKGKISFDDQIIFFDGVGHRDHAWGVRNWGVIEKYCWASGKVGSLSFTVVQLQVLGYRIVGGFIFQNGQFFTVEKLKIFYEFDSPGICSSNVRIDFKVKDGKEHYVINGKIFSTFPILLNSEQFRHIDTSNLTQWNWNNQVGFGVTEFFDRYEYI